jgi:AcrR family transcriptional regulator
VKPSPSTDPGQTSRFAERRERILVAAATLINEHGVKGMTFAEVARLVGMNQNSIAYYFKRKEMLAVAAFTDTIERMETRIDEASIQPDPRTRIDRYLRLVFASQHRLRLGEDRPMTALMDIPSLDEPYRSDLTRRYQTLVHKMRDLFAPANGELNLALNTARAHIVIETMLWLPVWLHLYPTDEFDRIRRRLFELLDRGVALEGTPLKRVVLDIGLNEAVDTDAGAEAYLRAATRLINRHGFRGASVERIAAELNLTKGSFYHHLSTKDELMLECFRRSCETVLKTQQAALDAGGSYWQRLLAAVTTLIDVQFSDRAPLLRITALSALPTARRYDVVAESTRTARRFAGMMIDGISEGSIRAIDPLIASQLILSMLHAAFDLREWADELGRKAAVEFYASSLAFGLFDD